MIEAKPERLGMETYYLLHFIFLHFKVQLTTFPRFSEGRRSISVFFRLFYMPAILPNMRFCQ